MVIRAIYVPIVFDESATFFHFVHRSDYWFFNSLPDANNHFLNSVLTDISYSFFGSSKLALRLPNLLALPLYLFYVLKIGNRIENWFIRWMWILSLMFMHFFVEFFALSRGYGLSMAFLMGAFYHLMKFVGEGKYRDIVFISAFIFLVEMSNLSALILVIAIIIYEFLIISFKKEKDGGSGKQILLIILIQIIPLAFSSYYMFFLDNQGSLYYGDSSGFWNLTVQSLILLVTGTKSHLYSIIVGIYILTLLLGTGIIIRREGLKVLAREEFALPVLLLLTVVGVVLLTEFFGINHPEDRVAMYFIPLFFGSLPMLMDIYYKQTKQLIFPILVMPFLLFPYQFVKKMNIDFVNGYKTEVLPEYFFEIIDNDELSSNEFPPTIGGYRMRMFCWTYQNFQAGGRHNIINYQSYPESQSDFQIVDINEYPQWIENYDIIAEEDVLGRKLLKRKIPVTREFYDSEISNSRIETTDQFIRLASWYPADLPKATFYITVDLNVYSSAVPLHAWVVMQLVDNNGKSLMYKNMPLDWLKTSWKEDNSEFKHVFLTGEIPDECKEIRFYIWNLDKEEIILENSNVKLFTIKK